MSGASPRRRRAALVALCAIAALSGGYACTTLAGGTREPREPRTVPARTVIADSSAVAAPTDSVAAVVEDPLGAENRVDAPVRARAPGGGPLVRVVVAGRAGDARLTSTGDWRLYDGGGRSVLVRARSGESWRVEARGARLRAVRSDGTPTLWRDGPFVAAPVSPATMVSVGGKRYRGEILVSVTDSGLLVVNRLPLEDYLRGVVPLEIGERSAGERAAVEAQAVAARSYTVTRLTNSPRGWDLLATVSDQVYGGADAERPVSDAAVAATSGLVLRYGGRTVSAPYHSTCGGSTAETSESWWRQRDEPYLRRVSDRIPGTDRFYCDASPRFRWTQSWTGPALQALVDRYLRQYAAVPGRDAGEVRALSVDGRTPSGRASAVTVVTDRGRYTVRGDDARWVLRTPGGEILNSTYFSVETMVVGRDGRLAQLTLRGTGYGHGIGMCQWGAIGRARAGQDFRTILRTYYPGTTVARAS